MAELVLLGGFALAAMASSAAAVYQTTAREQLKQAQGVQYLYHQVYPFRGYGREQPNFYEPGLNVLGNAGRDEAQSKVNDGQVQ